MLLIRFHFSLVLTLLLFTTFAQPGKLRATFTEDPSTTISIIFNTNNSSETKPQLYYSTNINAVVNNTAAVAYRDDILSNNSMDMYNNLVKLTGLAPGTKYYFKIKDDTGETQVYYFETIPDTPNERLSFIAGGDSRQNRTVRQNANMVVSKLKAHAVFFDGDFTSNSNADEWQRWLDDWQLTISNDGRITPLVVARGNHERNNAELTDLFGTNSTATYALSFGGNLFKAYTLNSENTVLNYVGQTDWLKQQLANDQDFIFKFAQYHKPMRPHTRLKLDGASQYAYWAPLFYQYSVDLVLESDAHTYSTSYPVIPCAGGFNCINGFKEDAYNGTVYTGQGGWGAPLRAADDKRSWTFDADMINQFKLIFVDKDKIELRTIKFENSLSINEVDVNNRFNLPAGLSIQAGTNKLTGQPQDVLIIPNKKGTSYPKIEIALPTENAIYYNSVNVDAIIKTLSPVSEISKVVFYLDGVKKGEDTSVPFSFRFNESEFSLARSYEINAIAYDVNGIASPITTKRIKVLSECINTASTQLQDSYNDAEESLNGRVDLGNFDLDMGYDGFICGLRFTNANLPPNVSILDARIQFTADEYKFNPTDLIIYGEDNANSSQFLPNSFDISGRTKVPVPVYWNNVPNWENVGDAGQNQKTPDLKNIVQHLVNNPDWSVESPITFIIEGNGYRVAETFEGDSTKAPILIVEYSSCVDNGSTYENVWPGDADNNGNVNAKDVLYICIADGLQGYSRPAASINWEAQTALPWPNNIGAINLAHQDTNGDGVINLDDIAAVDLNYGKEVESLNPMYDVNNDNLILDQVSSPGDEKIMFNLILKAAKPKFAHGITGSLDLSDFLQKNENTVETSTDFTAMENAFDADLVFAKYDEATKILDFTVSKTDKVNEQINDRPLLRLIIVIDPIEGGKLKNANFNNCGIINSDGRFEALKASQNQIINIDIENSVSRSLVENVIKLNLLSRNTNCYSKGSAEIIVSDDMKNEITLLWSNNATTNSIEGLDAGEYYVIIEHRDGVSHKFDFSIKNESNIEEQLQISQPVLRDGIYSATDKICLKSGTVISKSKTVEFLIEDCD